MTDLCFHLNFQVNSSCIKCSLVAACNDFMCSLCVHRVMMIGRSWQPGRLMV